MSERKKKSNFVIQGGQKATAMLITTALVILRMSFIASKAGMSGMNYYFVPMAFFALLYGIFGMALPDVMRKQISFQVCRGGFKNARKIYKVIASLHMILTILIALICFLLSESLSRLLFHSALYSLNIKILSGAFVLVIAQRGIRGYLEGVNNVFPGIVAGYIANLISIVTTVLIQNSCLNYGNSMSAFMRQDAYFYAYASLSGPVGFAAGNLFGFLFLLLIICLFRSVQSEKIRRDDTKRVLSSFDVIASFYRAYLSEMLAKAAIPCAVFVLVICYCRAENASVEGLGMISMGVFLFMLPTVIIAYMIANPLVRHLTGILRKQDKHHARERIAINYKLLTYYVFPYVAFLLCMTGSFAQVLFDNTSDELIHVMRSGIWAIVCVSLGVYMYYVLTPLRPKGLLNAILYVGIIVGFFCYGLFEKSKMSPVDAYIYSLFLAALLVDLIFAASLVKRLRFFDDLIRIFLLPLVAAIVVGIVAFALNKIFGFASDLIALVISILVNYVVYHIVLIMTHTFDKHEWNEVPANRIPLFLAKKLNMY